MQKSVKETRFVVLIDGYITNFEEIKSKYNLSCHTPHELISELLEHGESNIGRGFLGILLYLFLIKMPVNYFFFVIILI